MVKAVRTRVSKLPAVRNSQKIAVTAAEDGLLNKKSL